MITKLLLLLWNGARQVIYHPRILFVLTLTVVFPVLLILVLNQFSIVAQNNYTTAIRQRTGVVHDTAQVLLRRTLYDHESIRGYIQETMESNGDITDIVVAKETRSGITLYATKDGEGEETVVDDPTPYTRALAVPGAPLAFEFFVNGERFWDTTSTFSDGNTRWFIVTRQSLAGFDSVIKSRERSVYGLLFVTFLFLFGLGYWLVRDLDYRTKFNEQKHKLTEQNHISNMIAHELRSPLTAMRGYASMIEEHSAPGDVSHEYAQRITQSTDRLVRLVNDFLEVARLQSGQLKIEPVVCDVADVIVHACDELRPLADQKGLELVYERKSEKELKLLTDEARLHQLLVNITSNAIKYTINGRVTIESHEDRNNLEIRVKDTGMGISAEDQRHLFTPFFRVQNDDTKLVTGTGLGMWITKQLVERLGGTIGVESIKGVGTNIVMTFKKDHFSKK